MPGDAKSRAPRPRSSQCTALCLSQTTTLRQTFDEDVIGCRRLGVSHLAVWRNKLEDFGLDCAVELLQGHEVRVSSLNWAGGFTGGSGFTFDEAVDDARIAIEQARVLGARTLTIATGPMARHIPSHAHRLLRDGLDATVDLAAEHGITLALQPISSEFANRWSFLTSLRDTLKIVRKYGHPYLGIAFGTFHLWGESELFALIQKAAPYIATVQLCDGTRPRSEYDRRLPGQGDIPIPAMVKGLIESGYRGDFEIDVWSEELWKSGNTAPLTDCVRHCTALLDSCNEAVRTVC